MMTRDLRELLTGAADELGALEIPESMDVEIEINIHGVTDRRFLLDVAQRLDDVAKGINGTACWVEGTIGMANVTLFYPRGLLGESRLGDESGPSIREWLAGCEGEA